MFKVFPFCNKIEKLKKKRLKSFFQNRLRRHPRFHALHLIGASQKRANLRQVLRIKKQPLPLV
ncbi:MAG: hypothetical protein CRN43_11185 [Candidatus Nephrothrix sp. EaCA]|nr:MAG: hypothetical protein CRN43_11185 [Candidatus Nephrothrix sp. EaCA]